MGTPVISLDCKLYQDTNYPGAASWAEINVVRDVTATLEYRTVDVTTRASSGNVEELNTLRVARLEFEMLNDPSDARLTALRAAAWAKTVVHLRALNGANGGGSTVKGIDFAGQIRTMTDGQPFEGAETISFTLTPAPAGAPAAV